MNAHRSTWHTTAPLLRILTPHRDSIVYTRYKFLNPNFSLSVLVSYVNRSGVKAVNPFTRQQGLKRGRTLILGFSCTSFSVWEVCTYCVLKRHILEVRKNNDPVRMGGTRHIHWPQLRHFAFHSPRANPECTTAPPPTFRFPGAGVVQFVWQKCVQKPMSRVNYYHAPR